MADTTFTDLPQGTVPLSGTEITGGDQSGTTTVKFTTQDIADLAQTSAPPQYGNYIVQGGGVNWLGTGFQYSVSAANYVIGGANYSSAQTNLTLSASDPTDPRIDVFAVTSSGTAIVIEGVPASSPLKPAVDSVTQFEIGFVYVAAGAVTAPVTNLNIYLNNAEWTAVSSSVRINVDSVSNPFAGTKDIEATAAVALDTVTLTNGAPVTLNIYSNLTMQLRSKATWASQKRLQFQWRLGTANVGIPVQIRGSGTYGFNSATTGSYQSVVIPITDFGVGTGTADNLLISVVGGGSSFGWYLDNLINQAGVQSAIDTTGEDMSFIGAYNAAASYNEQDTVTSSGRTYTAIQSVPAGTAVTNTAYWSQIAVGAAGVDVVVADGGTGVSSLTAYAPIFGGTTSTGAVQSGTVGTSGQILTSNGAGALPTFQTASFGLTNWTEAVNTSAPNATIPVASFTAANAATNVDATIVSKGTGGLLRQVPDNTSTGGNKRGTRSVDLSSSRTTNTQVASGAASVIAGGLSQTASGSGSFVGGGETNIASGTQAVVCGGNICTASGDNSVVAGGSSNTASGVYAWIPGGSDCTADAQYSSAEGGAATARGIYGAGAKASGGFGGGGSVGSAQKREFVLRAGTTDATATVLTTNAGAASTTNQVVLPNNSVFGFRGILTVREAATEDSKSIEFKGSIKRGANAASTALQGVVVQADLGTADAGSATWTVAFTANTTNGCLTATVTGEAAHTLRWAAYIETTEVTG